MEYEQLILSFTSIIYEAMPFIVLGVVLAGILEEFVPQQAISKVIPKSPTLAIMLGALLGAVFPMCECGIIVVMKRLLRKGLPLSVCVAYMLAGPIINVVVAGSTYVAFEPTVKERVVFGGPWGVVILRLGLGYVVAVVTAMFVEMQTRRIGVENQLAPSIMKGLKPQRAFGVSLDVIEPPRTIRERFLNISSTALHDFIDIMAFLVIGATLASLGRSFLSEEMFNKLSEGTSTAGPLLKISLQILIMMGLAVLFCLCSEADAFVAANFPMYWLPASKLAFLVLGPMLDLKLYVMYTRVYRPKLIFTIITAVAVQIFLYSLVIHQFEPAISAFFESVFQFSAKFAQR
ncbi:MAG: permease [Gemmataceae bacterium]